MIPIIFIVTPICKSFENSFCKKYERVYHVYCICSHSSHKIGSTLVESTSMRESGYIYRIHDILFQKVENCGFNSLY